jgi:2,3,4,5-tetrahydropyridine-2-carboxylate N-succinyltransferase
MNRTELEVAVNIAWEDRQNLTPATHGLAREAVEATLMMLDRGEARVAEPVQSAIGREWRTHQWLKKAVLLSFRLFDNARISGAPGPWWDKTPLKFAQWSDDDFRAAGLRAVPGAIARRGAYIAPSTVLLPSFVNIGAYVDEGSMIDAWATVGSCAQIGKRCHISGGAGIGGVLEPLQANPVIIEDGCFIGARAEVAEGVIVREGSVLSMGVYLGASTKIVDRESGAVVFGEVPPFSVVVPGAMPSKNGGPSLYCAVIVKRVDAQTRSKTSVNELLRD